MSVKIMCFELWLIQGGDIANIYVKTDMVLTLIGFGFFPWCDSSDADSPWHLSAFCHSHLKAYERKNGSRTSELSHSAISSWSLTSHLPSAGYYSPLICYRCLIQGHVKCRFVSELYRWQNDQMMREKQVQLQFLSMRLQQHLRPSVYCIH